MNDLEFYSILLGRKVSAVYEGVPICEVPSIEDLAAREDWPEVRAKMRDNLRDWWHRTPHGRQSILEASNGG